MRSLVEKNLPVLEPVTFQHFFEETGLQFLNT